jgi:hypothetical protein
MRPIVFSTSTGLYAYIPHETARGKRVRRVTADDPLMLEAEIVPVLPRQNEKAHLSMTTPRLHEHPESP